MGQSTIDPCQCPLVDVCNEDLNGMMDVLPDDFELDVVKANAPCLHGTVCDAFKTGYIGSVATFSGVLVSDSSSVTLGELSEAGLHFVPEGRGKNGIASRMTRRDEVIGDDDPLLEALEMGRRARYPFAPELRQ